MSDITSVVTKRRGVHIQQVSTCVSQWLIKNRTGWIKKQLVGHQSENYTRIKTRGGAHTSVYVVTEIAPSEVCVVTITTYRQKVTSGWISQIFQTKTKEIDAHWDWLPKEQECVL